jgi:NAD-dependent deacetylase
MKNVVVFSGAGISAESGIKTFRDTGGLWEEYRIEDVATPGAWHRNAALVLDFYNQRRAQVLSAQPNSAHSAIADLEKYFNVQVITQNIDDLHERAGSSNVLHLHGEIRKSRSTLDEHLIFPIEGSELKMGDVCPLGAQLRPHIVWFGEAVPEMEKAISITSKADIFIVIGTSLEVYPAAGLLEYAPDSSLKILVDPHAKIPAHLNEFSVVRKSAGVGVPEVLQKIIENNV